VTACEDPRESEAQSSELEGNQRTDDTRTKLPEIVTANHRSLPRRSGPIEELPMPARHGIRQLSLHSIGPASGDWEDHRCNHRSRYPT